MVKLASGQVNGRIRKIYTNPPVTGLTHATLSIPNRQSLPEILNTYRNGKPNPIATTPCTQPQEHGDFLIYHTISTSCTLQFSDNLGSSGNVRSK